MFMSNERLILIYLILAFSLSGIMRNRSESTDLSTTVLIAARQISGFLAIMM